MKIEDFKTIGKIKYGDFALIDYTYNEIVIDDSYGLRALKEKYGNSIKTILDIGGNLGLFSVFAREQFPEARIISLEALEDTYISLKENTKHSNVEVYNIALGDGSLLYLNRCPDHSGANQFRKDPIQANQLDVTIQSKTLKTIFEELKIEGPYVIKMDIEGCELFLYEDSTCVDILKNCIYFTMEYHTVNLLGYPVPKPLWDKWLMNIFTEFDIDGLGGDAPGATYRIIKK